MALMECTAVNAASTSWSVTDIGASGSGVISIFQYLATYGSCCGGKEHVLGVTNKPPTCDAKPGRDRGAYLDVVDGRPRVSVLHKHHLDDLLQLRVQRPELGVRIEHLLRL